ncbi:aldo/keto reductase, partial [Lactiplantibacillus pentosus]|uniref:aldo/keto reductase n=1 Tax=Lactiplantibacillus pentosus TaxID=1589 RepID=UPI00314055B5
MVSEYSLWTGEQENELLSTLVDLGIGFVPFSPLGKGYLTGKLTAASKFTKADEVNNLPGFTEAAIAANQQLLNVIAEFATAKQATPAQIAVAWLSAQTPW